MVFTEYLKIFEIWALFDIPNLIKAKILNSTVSASSCLMFIFPSSFNKSLKLSIKFGYMCKKDLSKLALKTFNSSSTTFLDLVNSSSSFTLFVIIYFRTVFRYTSNLSIYIPSISLEMCRYNALLWRQLQKALRIFV